MTAVPAADHAGSQPNAGPIPIGRRSVLRGLGALAGLGAAAGLLSGCGSDALAGVPATAMAAAASSLDPYFPGYGAGGFLVNHYALALAFAADLSGFDATATLQIMPYAALTGLSLDLRGPVVRSVQVNGRNVRFAQLPSGKLQVIPPNVLPAGRFVSVRIGYTARRTPVSVAGVGQAGWLQVGSSAPAAAAPTATAASDVVPGAAGSGAAAPTATASGTSGSAVTALGAAAPGTPSPTATAPGTPAPATGTAPATSQPATINQPDPAVCIISLPVGASTWYPCVDHPSSKAAYDISVTVPDRFSVLANGRLTGKTTRSGQSTWSYHHPGPMASYLVSVQVGAFDLDDAAAAQGGAPADVLIRNAYPAAVATAARYDLGRQGQMISVFAKLFGAYPFDVFGTAVVDGLPTQGGSGGENPVRRSFAAQTLGLLDASLVDGRRTNENLVANAVARQWFGAGITVADWSQYWLTEGFATYAEWLWAEHTGGIPAAAAARAAMTRLRAMPQDLIIADPGAQRILDARLGLRGACFLQSLRQTVGDLQFFQILQVWCNRAQAGTSATADFLQIIPDVYTANDLTQFSRDWVYAVALPELS